jgi:Fe-S cluster assembly protein SufB
VVPAAVIDSPRSPTILQLQELVNQPYKHGFVTDIESDVAPKGLNEDTIRMISAKKNEPEWLLEFRLDAYRAWLGMTRADMAERALPRDRFPGHQLLRRTPAEAEAQEHGRGRSGTAAHLREARRAAARAHAALAGVAVDVIFDSVSVATTYKARLAEVGIIFCSMSEAVLQHPELVQQVSRHGDARPATTITRR